jgi:hypothetical protein
MSALEYLSGGGVHGDRPVGGQRAGDRLRGPRADTGHLDQFVDTGGAHLLHRPEPAQQRLAPGLAQPGHAVQRGGGHGSRALLPVVGDGESVCLVAYPLQQVQRLRRSRQDRRVVLSRQPHLFQSLGEPDEGHVLDTQVAEDRTRSGDLRRPAVHDEQVRGVRELPWPARVGVDPGPSIEVRPSLGIRLRTFGHLLVQIAGEAAADGLGDPVGVTGPLPRVAQREAAVLALAW